MHVKSAKGPQWPLKQLRGLQNALHVHPQRAPPGGSLLDTWYWVYGIADATGSAQVGLGMAKVYILSCFR